VFSVLRSALSSVTAVGYLFIYILRLFLIFPLLLLFPYVYTNSSVYILSLPSSSSHFPASSIVSLHYFFCLYFFITLLLLLFFFFFFFFYLILFCYNLLLIYLLILVINITRHSLSFFYSIGRLLTSFSFSCFPPSFIIILLSVQISNSFQRVATDIHSLYKL